MELKTETGSCRFARRRVERICGVRMTCKCEFAPWVVLGVTHKAKPRLCPRLSQERVIYRESLAYRGNAAAG